MQAAECTMPRGNQRPSVSVIVPIYNMESYLRQCLDSIVHQTLSDIEIICVDDGSTDSSRNILQEYAAADSRIIVISHDNYGYGYSLNRGIERATGDYIGIVESDDWIDATMFEDLTVAARLADVDMAKCNFYLTWTKEPARKKLYEYVSKAEDGLVVTPRDYQEGVLFRKKPCVWSAIYRQEFITKNEIAFLETPGASYQDTSFSFKTLALAEKVALLHKPYIHYNQDNEASSTNAKDNAYSVCTEYAEIEKFISSLPAPREHIDKAFAPALNATFMWNYRRLRPTLKYPFLKVASKYFQRLNNEDKVYWDSFSKNKRKMRDFRMVMNHPFAYHLLTMKRWVSRKFS